RELGSASGGQSPGRSERMGRRGSGRQWVGVDEHDVRTISRVPSDGVVSGVLGRLFRRRAFRHEGRVAGDCVRAAAPDVSQLVPRAISLRLRDIQMRKVNTPAERTSLAQFAGDVQYYLTLRPRQLPSRYLYDALGSALFDAICHLPWYRITRAEMRLLAAHGRSIFTCLPGLKALVELGPGSG